MTITLSSASCALHRNWRRDTVVLVLIVCACAVPFLSQPFHMDDNFYMDMARNAQQNPLFPNDTPYMFEGQFWRDLGSHSHPLLQTYFLAALQCFFGEGPGKEWIYHLFALLYPVIAVLSFYFICARFVERPLWPSLLLACSPLFLVMQHTVMTDIPALAFWLAAIGSFLWAAGTRRTGLYAASTLLQTAAMFTSYQSFALTPLLAFYHFRKGGGRRGWASVALAPAIIVAWYALNCFHYKRMLFGITFDFVQSRHPLSLEVLGTKLFSILAYQGWLILFPFFIFYVLARGMKGRALALVLLIAAFLAQMRIHEYRLVDKGIFVLGLAAGFFVVLKMGEVARSAVHKEKGPLGFEKVDEQFLGLWYFGVLFYCIFFFPEGSARYILPLVPPFLICYFRRLEISEAAEYRLPARILNSAMVASGSLVVTLIWGLVLSHADLEFARIYPRAAKEFSRVTGGAESYSVGEWGFRYYLGMAGAKPMPMDESPVRGGSFIAVPKLALPHDIPANLRSMTMPVRTLVYQPETPLRILDWQTPAGFYSTGWGLIPFFLSKKSLEEIEIQQVNFMVERLPWAQIKGDSEVKPWPGYMKIQERSFLAIMAKPGTRIFYPMPIQEPTGLELLCGVSPEGFNGGEDAACEFEVRQLDADGSVLAETRLELRPGMKQEDRKWHPVRLRLEKTAKGTLDFGYSCHSMEVTNAGGFAQAILGRAD